MRRRLARHSLTARPCRAPAADAAVRTVIRGAGFGHGIGMSQYGAYGYALNGAKLPGDPRPLLQGHAALARAVASRARDPSARGPLHPRHGATRIGGHTLKLNRTYVARESRGQILVSTASGKRVARVGNGARFAGPIPVRLLGPALNGVTSGPYHGAIELRTEGRRAAPRSTCSTSTATYGAWSPARCPLAAARGAQGPGRGRAHVRAHHAQGRHGLFDQYPDTRSQVYRGVTGRERAQQRGGARDRGPDRHLRAACPR